MTILFGFIILIGVVKLLFDQLKNLFTNSTGFERRKQSMIMSKRSELLSSDSAIESDIADYSVIEEEERCSCFKNCLNMLG